MLLNWLFFPSLLSRQVTEVGYDELVSMVDDGKVETVSYDSQDHEIVFEAKDDKGKTALYKTGIFPDDALVDRLLKGNVKFAAEIPTQASPLVSMLVSYIVPIVLIIAVGQWLQKKMMKNMGGNMMSFGKSRCEDLRGEPRPARPLPTWRVRTRPRRPCTEIVDFLHNPDKYARHRREAAQGRAAGGPSGHRQDAAGQGRCGRGERAVLLHLRLASLWRCSWAWARPRCATCSSRPARRRPASSSSTRSTPSAKSATAAGMRRQRRARADAQPAAGRDGRLRRQQGRRHPGRDQPPGVAGPGAAASRPLRPPHPGGAARPAGPRAPS